MKTTPFLEYVVYDIFGESEPITFRAMMGAHVLYYDGKTFAIVDGEKLYFKGDKITEQWYMEHGAKKFWYMKEGKKQYMNYFLVTAETLENHDVFLEWFGVALSVAVLPKKKKGF